MTQVRYSTALLLCSSLIFGYLSLVVNSNLRGYKYRLPSDSINKYQDALRVLRDIEDKIPGSEGFITDPALILALGNNCHRILDAVLTMESRVSSIRCGRRDDMLVEFL